MKFRLVEACVYKLEYENTMGKPDHAYIIGNNNSEFDTKIKISEFLRLQRQRGHEVISPNVNSIISLMPNSGISYTKLGIDDEKNSFRDKHRYLNFTHSTSRKNAPTMAGYLRHHLDGIEQNNYPENILGISTDGPAKALHVLLHDTGFESLSDITRGSYLVLVYDGKEYVRKELSVRMQIVDEGSE